MADRLPVAATTLGAESAADPGEPHLVLWNTAAYYGLRPEQVPRRRRIDHHDAEGRLVGSAVVGLDDDGATTATSGSGAPFGGFDLARTGETVANIEHLVDHALGELGAAGPDRAGGPGQARPLRRQRGRPVLRAAQPGLLAGGVRPQLLPRPARRRHRRPLRGVAQARRPQGPAPIAATGPGRLAGAARRRRHVGGGLRGAAPQPGRPRPADAAALQLRAGHPRRVPRPGAAPRRRPRRPDLVAAALVYRVAPRPRPRAVLGRRRPRAAPLADAPARARRGGARPRRRGPRRSTWGSRARTACPTTA